MSNRSDRDKLITVVARWTLLLLALGFSDQIAQAVPTVTDAINNQETARDLVRALTAVSTVPSSLIGMKIAFGQDEGRESLMSLIKGIGVGFGGPTLVYLVGMLIVNAAYCI